MRVCVGRGWGVVLIFGRVCHGLFTHSAQLFTLSVPTDGLEQTERGVCSGLTVFDSLAVYAHQQ